MSRSRIPRLRYKRRMATYRLPEFLIERMKQEDISQTQLVETAVMHYLRMEYPHEHPDNECHERWLR